MSSFIIKKDNFDLKQYVKNAAHKTKKTSFYFKKDLIKEIPLVEDGVIDLFDLTNDIVGYSFVLRITKTRKTFYIKSAQRTMTKIGPWQYWKDNKSSPPKPFLSLADARKKFKKQVKELQNIRHEVSHIRDWTVIKYLEEQYKSDRKIYQIKNGKIKHVAEKAFRQIRSDIKPIENYKIKDITIAWLDELIEHWEKRKEHPTNGIISSKSLDSQLRAYTQINAMFNIWVRASYISNNPISCESYRFRDEDTQEREINIYTEFTNEEALRFIFQDHVPGSLAGKLVLATMIVAGVRNSEAYRNYRDNFRVEKKEIFIPSSISKKSKKSRPIPIESRLYWKMITHYLSTSEYYKNDHGHMFPSHKMSESGHVADGITRKPWAALKKAFKLPNRARPYDFRHTYASTVTREHSIDIASKLTGDRPETLLKHYIRHEINDLRPSLARIQNDSVEPEDNAIEVTPENPEIVPASDSGMPDSIKQLFNTYKNGKALPGPDQMYAEQWNKFVNIVRQMHDNNMIENAEIWLMLQD